MTTNPRNARRLPGQPIRAEANRTVTQIAFPMVDPHALPAEALQPVCGTIAEVVFLRPFVANGNRLKDRRTPASPRGQMFLFELRGKLIEAQRATLQEDLIIVGQGADIGQVERLVQVAAEARLGIPIVEHHPGVPGEAGLRPSLVTVAPQGAVYFDTRRPLPVDLDADATRLTSSCAICAALPFSALVCFLSVSGPPGRVPVLTPRHWSASTIESVTGRPSHRRGSAG